MQTHRHFQRRLGTPPVQPSKDGCRTLTLQDFQNPPQLSLGVQVKGFKSGSNISYGL